MYLYIRYFLEIAVLIPAAVFALIPVRKWTRYNRTVTFVVSLGISLVISALGGVFCVIYELTSNHIIFITSPFLLAAYMYFVRTTLFKKLFCFFFSAVLVSFCTMYTNYIAAPLELGEAGLPFTVSSSMICMGLNLVIFILFFRALSVWIPFFLDNPILKKTWSKLFLLPVILTVFIYWIIPYRAENVVVGRTRIIGMALIVWIPIIIWGYMYVVWWMLKRHMEYDRVLKENTYLVMEKNRYAKFNDYNDQMRRLRHDFRHQVLLIDRYVETEDYRTLKEHIKGLKEEVNVSPKRLCANNAVDAVAYYYKSMAESEGIETEFYINLPAEMPWKDVQLGTIFGNLLENAVRETKKVEGRSRSIKVISQMISDDMLGISVENPYVGKIRFGSDGLPVSDEPGHGIGLDTVAVTVSGLDGTLDINTDDGIFLVNILIQSEKESYAPKGKE